MVFNIQSGVLLFAGILLILLSACTKPEPIHDLSNQNFALRNQDSTAASFPADFEGNYLVVAFIYTRCPDICNITTANMKNISNRLEDISNIQFVEITFDPRRDTPRVLNDYMQTFKLDEDRFTLLTGHPASVDSVLNAMNIQAAIAYHDTTDSGKITYTMNHTDRIVVMDTEGRVRFEYPGSKIPPEHVIEDLNTIR